jgi:hypothetical protein
VRLLLVLGLLAITGDARGERGARGRPQHR